MLFSKAMSRPSRTSLTLFGSCGKASIYAEENTQVLNMYEVPC